MNILQIPREINGVAKQKIETHQLQNQPRESHILLTASMMEYAIEELPLPSFAEVFGDGVLSNPLKKKKKTSGGSNMEINGEETTG